MRMRMDSIISPVCALSMVLFLGACVRGVEKEDASVIGMQEGQGQLIIYRPAKSNPVVDGVANSFVITELPEILVEGVALKHSAGMAKCLYNTAHIVNMKPGSYGLTIDLKNIGDAEQSMRVGINPGGRTFVRCRIKKSAGEKKMVLESVSPYTGAREVAKARLAGVYAR